VRHLYNESEDNLTRYENVGLIWGVQGRAYLAANGWRATSTPICIRGGPPVAADCGQRCRLGLTVAGGTGRASVVLPILRRDCNGILDGHHHRRS